VGREIDRERERRTSSLHPRVYLQEREREKEDGREERRGVYFSRELYVAWRK
jgi:hypothetical protein